MASERLPTIYEALAEKLGRAPTDAECCAEVRRILGTPDRERWAIYSEADMDLAWSNADGWVSGPDFDIFTMQERCTLSLPIGGVWRRVA